MKIVFVKDLVQDTYTNRSGTSLAIQIEKYIEKGESVQVSMTGSTPMSSSFFNSSFGHLVEKYGYPKMRELVKFVGVNASQGNLLKNYFSIYKDYDLGYGM